MLARNLSTILKARDNGKDLLLAPKNRAGASFLMHSFSAHTKEKSNTEIVEQQETRLSWLRIYVRDENHDT